MSEPTQAEVYAATMRGDSVEVAVDGVVIDHVLRWNAVEGWVEYYPAYAPAAGRLATARGEVSVSIKPRA